MNRLREARRELAAVQIEDLNDYQRGVVVLAGLGCGLVTFVTDAALVVVATRAIRRGWRQRQLGPARAVAAGVAPAWGWAVGLIAAQAAAGNGAVWVVNRQLAAHPEPSGPPGPSQPDPPGAGVPDPPTPG
jgi:hypothetical protein